MFFTLFNIFGLLVLLVLGGACLLSAYLFISSLAHRREKDTKLSIFFFFFYIVNFTVIFGLPVMLFFDFMGTYKERPMEVGFDFDTMGAVQVYLLVCVALSAGTVFAQSASKQLSEQEEVNWIRVGWAGLKFFVFYGLLLALAIFHANQANSRVRVLSLELEGLQLSSSDSIVLETNELVRVLSAPSPVRALLLVPAYWMGLLLFIFFGSVGMAAIPIELVSKYFYRPVVADPETHVLAKQVLLETNTNLLIRAKAMYDLKAKLATLRSQNLKGEVALNEKLLASQLIAMQEDTHYFREMKDHFDAIENILDENPLYYLLCLVCGVLAGLFSVLFILALFALPTESSSIISRFFQHVESYSSLLAFVFFCCFVGFCLVSVLKGMEKFALMFPNVVPFAPLRGDKTWTRDFFIISMILLLSIVAILGVNLLIFTNLFRFTNVSFFMEQVVTTGLGFLLIKWNVIAYIFVFMFPIAIFVAYFMNSGPTLMAEKVEFMRQEVEKKKRNKNSPQENEEAEALNSAKNPQAKENETQAPPKPAAPEPKKPTILPGVSELF